MGLALAIGMSAGVLRVSSELRACEASQVSTCLLHLSLSQEECTLASLLVKGG